jgi:prepilin-type N-terminal cleavage/methylation domain-containing protein
MHRSRPAGFRARRNRCAGFSLIELMVVIVVIGIMAAMAAPSFNRAVEQSRANIAYANLQAIWAAQRVYWLEKHAYNPKLYDESASNDLYDLGLVDRAVGGTSMKYTYGMTADETTFSATATRTSGDGWTGSFTIDSNGTLSGSVSGGGTTITPGALQ